MGQPMSSSYENRWLSTGDDNSKKGSPLINRRKSITPEEKSTSVPAKEKKDKVATKEKKVKENTRPHNPNAPPKKAQKDMTKAERRALQEKQRQAKEAAKDVDNKKNPTANTSSAASTAPATSGTTSADSEAAKRKKKTTRDQNQVPWLLHLDVPKVSEALTKDLHPAVLQLGLYFSEYKIVGSNARCVAMLEIFSKVCILYMYIYIYIEIDIKKLGYFRSQTSFRCHLFSTHSKAFGSSYRLPSQYSSHVTQYA